LNRRRRRRGRFAHTVSLALLVAIGLPVLIVLPWRWLQPPASAFMMQARAEGTEVQQRWVCWEAISPQLPIAVVAGEDQKFPEHHGFDTKSIRSVLEEKGPSGRGASTISQQVVKNLYLWSGRSWIRKGIEAYLTLFVETLWPKRRILEIYLNIAEFGPGIYGAEAAAGSFFGKPASALNEREAALLAAVLPSPKRMSAGKPSAYVQQRAEWIRRQMQQLGGVSYLENL
jgi:monofunctional biosynthetic peptidoglycan transglycosylase